MIGFRAGGNDIAKFSSVFGLLSRGPGNNLGLGLFKGLVAGDDLACVSLVGVGMLDSLPVGL